ncbi:nucleotidyltransferase family protein [Pseudotabrizicola algicola]|uniref:Nucleotidyltransferase family protein n=1 Tax=Pseudotabrizicola algicola TaxID=2709381 RepID=A0A6B3RLM9_9RHOB|nr:nucleotidyltransferase family protein [Pseudotabrizicola algicola]NEX45165.1 nucleotidyltransferase family protein [Pseudotabrizicola algicola]
MPSPPPEPLHILILAAGGSTRMRGADKLTEPVAGQPLLRHLAGQALASGLPVTVALSPAHPRRIAALHGLPVTLRQVPDAAKGMAHSLRAGLAHLPPEAAVLLLLADLPEITAQDLTLMAEAHRAAPGLILRATSQTGTPGHPVIFPAWVRPELMALSGDEGARAVLDRHPARLGLIALPDQHATTDLDTPEAWDAWRSGRE